MANTDNKKLIKTANLLREAIPKMSQLNIPLTPENYHVWLDTKMQALLAITYMKKFREKNLSTTNCAEKLPGYVTVLIGVADITTEDNV